MKILHICTGFPISYQGGITNYVRMLATEQVNYGNDVTVLGAEDKKKNNFKYRTYKSKKIKPFSYSKAQDEIELNKLEEFLLNEQFDLIHIHMMLDIDYRLVDILKDRFVYIISLHDYYYLCPRIIMMDKSNNLCSKLDLKKCKKCISRLEMIDKFRVLESKWEFYTNKKLYYPRISQEYTNIRYNKFKELLENANLLLPVSHRVKQIYCDSGILGNYKVLHIGNNTANEYKEFNEKLFVPNKKINITILGALTYHKGAEILFELMEKVRNDNLEFNFHGRVDGSYEKKFIELGGINNGPYNQSDMKQILEKSDLGLVLSNWEDNAPQVVMEFLNNNVPILATQMGGIPDFVNDFNGYLFNPYDSSGIANAIKFLDNYDLDKVIELKKNIKRTKTPEEHLSEINDVYEELLNNRTKEA